MREPTIVAEITAEPLNGGELSARLRSTEDGAVVVFEGRVRDSNQGRPVVRLRYEAYAEMAERVLTEIASEAGSLYEVGAVGAAHRTGALELGEASVVVVAAAAHRAAAYDASRYVIEAIKQRLPMWKEEQYADGSTAWLGERPVEGEAR
ncbi:MAG: molybdenum cofactor biosynthesis protein MoaE [Gemmatimonadota bacterium]